jgi:hypothetical protein
MPKAGLTERSYTNHPDITVLSDYQYLLNCARAAILWHTDDFL